MDNLTKMSNNFVTQNECEIKTDLASEKIEHISDIMEIGFKQIIDNQETLLEEVAKIKKIQNDPDTGVRKKVNDLMGWKKNINKLLWIIITALMGLSCTGVGMAIWG